nr:oligosaccharide MFS transporter [Paenibacillus maysiensis]
MTPINKQLFWKLSSFLFFFQAAWAAAYSLFSLWLGETIGLNGPLIGTVFSINALFALAFKPVFGYFLDRLGYRKNVLWFISGATLLIAPFFIYVYRPLLSGTPIVGMLVGGLFIGFAFSAGIAAIESYIEKCGRQFGFEYGKVRSFGSLGFAFAAFFAGKLFNIDPNLNFWTASIFALITIFMLLWIKIPDQIKEQLVIDKDPVKVKDVFSLLKLKKFWFFIIYVFGVASIFFVMDQQFPRFFVSLFPSEKQGNEFFGYLNSVQIFGEAFFMFTIPFVVNKIGAKRGLLLAGAIMGIRILGTGFSTTISEVVIWKLLHSIELPILLISVFKYIAETFSQRLSSSMYLIGYQSINYIGVVIIGPIAGHLYETLGFPKTYMLMGTIVLISTALAILTLNKTPGNKLEATINSPIVVEK